MSFKVLSQSIVRLTQDVWGDDVSYTPNGGTPVVIKGIFQNSFVEVEGVVSMKPVLRINLLDLLVIPAKGDSVIIDTINYRVIESKIDGHGGSTLILQK